jgi:amino acid transporter
MTRSLGESPVRQPLQRAAQVIVVSSVMFTFISSWRTAAVVLCDMSSTVYYIGAIVETAIGKAAPWFILAVLLFSYAMRSVYIESCALFVRGGVYRVVKEAMGGFLAKLSVSALLFDYVLTGPISGVSAGQYIVGLGLEAVTRFTQLQLDEATRQTIKSWGSVVIACFITIYFFRQNLKGIPESSDKASKIMMATTILGVILLVWCGVTLAVKGPVNAVPSPAPDLHKKVELEESGKQVPKMNPITGAQEDPLGFLGQAPAVAAPLRDPPSWLSLVGLIGIIIAFGHSILAMSGEETLAQVYREVEAPKLPNFKKAAFIVFLYSLLLTGIMNFLALLMIPDQQRMGEYYDNWMGGLAMQLLGPPPVLLLLNALVVLVGFLILSGAVNTSIIGSNGVLNRVAEDGVLPDWFLKPHHRYGTHARTLYLITGLQLFTILASRGDMILLGEAYAFGVVWSFVFKSLAMVVLRFKDRTEREFKVPLNFRIGKTEIPLGLLLIFLVVFLSALANLATKQVATISGAAFTLVILTVFVVTERINERRRRYAKHEHLEQFNRTSTANVSAASLELTKPYRKLVAIRSPQNLFMLEKALWDTDPQTTDVVVMTAKIIAGDASAPSSGALDPYDQRLMTAVVERAESFGKEVIPLIVPTNNPLHAVLRVAFDLQAQEVVVGASNKFTAEEQLDQISFYWVQVQSGEKAGEKGSRGLTVRILGRERDVTFDLFGGRRIPTVGEERAKSAAQLRDSGVGVDRILFLHDGTQAASDLLVAAVTVIDPEVALDVALLPHPAALEPVIQDRMLLARLRRRCAFQEIGGSIATELLQLIGRKQYGLVMAPGAVLNAPGMEAFKKQAPCFVGSVQPPAIPKDVVADA